MSRYSSPDHPLPASWWAELKRLLRARRQQVVEHEPDGLGALFVRRREVSQKEIATCYVQSSKYLSHVADRLKEAHPVVVSLEEMSEEDAARALDFISGVAYALDGACDPVAERVYLFVPGNVTIVEEEQ